MTAGSVSSGTLNVDAGNLGAGNSSAPSPSRATNPAAGIDYQLFLDCVHCGLCTASCPTYVELGNENDSPRGRIYLMRNIADEKLELTKEVRRHLELCLDCRSCETACPSGVQYGKLIEPFRVAMEKTGGGAQKSEDWFHRWILFGLFPHPGRLRASLWPARIAQRLGLHQLFVASGLWKLLPPRLGRLVTMLPKLEKPEPALPRVLPAKGKQRARVALFTGCVGDVMFRRTNWATARVLQENGCEVIVPEAQACCGAIHFHAGADAPAKELAERNVAAFDASNVDAIIVNVAGCGAMLKDYRHHFESESRSDVGYEIGGYEKGKYREFVSKVKDVHEFLDSLGIIPPQGEIKTVATYHDACHLGHAQKIREQPRRLLAKIPGLKLVDLPETEICCGAAGTYNLTEPEMADRLSQRKMKHILSTGARTVVTANAGCLLQIMREARMRGEKLKIVHPMELLDLSYRGEKLGV
jgi:glycolate oxidase iron-sulfur subunit